MSTPDRTDPPLVRGVIFDLDGTLANTLGDIAYAVNRALESVDAPTRPVDAYAEWVGWGLKNLCKAALGEDEGERFDRFYETAVAEYNQFPMERTYPYPGIPEVLDELNRRDVPVGVATNKPHEFAVKIVETTFAAWSFVAVEGYQIDAPRKPDAASVLGIARAMELPPAEVALVGDSTVDVETARNAGMVAIGVSWGFRGPEELSEADRILSRATQLLEHVRS